MGTRKLIRVILIGALALLEGATQPARAADLLAPIALENTQVLPAGVRNPRFINVFSSIDSKFGDGGALDPLGKPLNKAVSWKDVLDSLENDQKRAQVAGLIQSHGGFGADGPGSTAGVVNTYANVKVPVLAAGLASWWTLAVAVPIIRIDVSASTGFVSGQAGQDFVAAASDSSSPITAEEAANKLNDAVNQKLTRLGYQTIPAHQTFSGVGDVQVVNKLQLRQTETGGAAVKLTATLPTGQGPDADKALDIPLGDDRYQLGATVIVDRIFPRWDLRWSSFGGYNAMLPRHLVKRIPTSVDDPLSADKDRVAENLRSQFSLGTSLDHQFTSTGVVVGAGYEYQYMTRADYRQGTAVSDPGRYLLLDDLEPLEAVHTLMMTAGFSTIEWFKQKKFVYPFQVNAVYSHPLAGRNVASSDVLAAELVLFF